MLCWFLPHNSANRPELYMERLPHRLPPFQVGTEGQAGFPAVNSSFSAALCFIHDSSHTSPILSPFVPFCPSPTASTNPF